MSSDRRGGGCLTFLAVLAAALFVVLAPLVLALFNVERSFLEPGLYKRAMVEQSVYERLPELVAEQLVYGSTAHPADGEGEEGPSEPTVIASTLALASPELTTCLQDELGPLAYAALAADSRPATEIETDRVKSCLRAHGVPAALADTHDGMPIYFWILTEEDWQTILEALLPPEWLQAQFESAIDQVHEALSGDGDGDVAISMAGLKARIVGDAGFNAVVALIEAQPPCSDDQLAQIQGLTDPSEPLKAVPVCRPPDVILTAMYPNIHATLAILAAEVPAQAEFELGGESGSAEDPLQRPREILGAARAAAYLSLLVPLALLGLVALLVVRSPRSLLRWWGVPILLAGVLTAAAAVAGLSTAQGSISDLMAGSRSSLTALAPGVLDLETDLIKAIIRGYLQSVLVQGVLLTSIGTIMVAASFYVGRPSVDPAEPQSVPPQTA